MDIKTSKMTAISIAFAVWFAYSVPAHAGSRWNFHGPSGGVVQADSDDDDHLSGGALAVLLLAIGGAVAGVLYAARPHGGNGKIACDRVSNEVTLRLNNTDANGNQNSRTLNAKLDEKTGTIRLITKGIDAAAKLTQSEWIGKADGTYYSVKGDPTVDQIAYTKVDGSTLEFSAKKADHVTLTGRISVSNNGRSLTISSNRTDPAGRRILTQTVFNSSH